jgi:phosphoenolpyruvate carboxykinase (ATP)
MTPSYTLETQGMMGLESVHYNLPEAPLIEAALKRGEGRLGRGASFL